MEQICTTKEQGAELLKLGIDRSTADMYWPLGFPFPEICDNEEQKQMEYPAWTLGALLNLAPAGTLFITKYKRVSIEIVINRVQQTYQIEYDAKTLFECVFKLIKHLLSERLISYV